MDWSAAGGDATDEVPGGAAAVALKVSWGGEVLTCEHGSKRRLISVTTQASGVKKIPAHLRLPTDVVLTETQLAWRVRGPPGGLFPEDVGEIGQDLAVDDDCGMDFVDELPVDDWTALARDRKVLRGGALAGWRFSVEIQGKLALTRVCRGG